MRKKSTLSLNLEQPAPTPNDMEARDRLGRARYRMPLQPNNGRDALRDAYAEALDLCVYLRLTIYERDGR